MGCRVWLSSKNLQGAFKPHPSRAKVNMSHVGAEWFELRYLNLCTYCLLIVAFRAFSNVVYS